MKCTFLGEKVPLSDSAFIQDMFLHPLQQYSSAGWLNKKAVIFYRSDPGFYPGSPHHGSAVSVL